MVVVLNSEASERVVDVTKELCDFDVAGIEYLLGIRYINKFKTNSVTSKRDYLALQNDITGYFFVNSEGKIYQTDVGAKKKLIDKSNIVVINN